MVLGLEKGDHVAVWGQDVPERVTLQFATGKTGRVLVTINPAYKAQELRYVLEQSDAAVLFLTEGKVADFVEILQSSPGPGRSGAWQVEGPPHLKKVALIGDEAGNIPGLAPYKEFVKCAEEVSEE